MKNHLSIPTGLRTLFVGVLLLALAAGCSKHEDDCTAPEENDTQSTTRASAADGAGDASEENRHIGNAFRGMEEGDNDMEDDGISDDGDDEADGEGNKKNRPQN